MPERTYWYANATTASTNVNSSFLPPDIPLLRLTTISSIH